MIPIVIPPHILFVFKNWIGAGALARSGALENNTPRQ